MCEIVCRKSSKSGAKYLVLIVNGVYVTFDRLTIEKVAMTNGISNLELMELGVDDIITIKGV